MRSKNYYRSKPYFSILNKILSIRYVNVEPPLDHESIEQLAIAVILSAQCTDERVNIVTKDLFKACPTIKEFNEISLERLKKLVYSTGFYNNKATNIKKLAKILVDDHDGLIPNDFELLCNLPGIGRKTANVIMGQAFGEAHGIVVDTHVRRICQRLGMTEKTTPVTVEKDLMKILPKKSWNDLPLRIIFLGREFCMARNPNCGGCVLKKHCPKLDYN